MPEITALGRRHFIGCFAAIGAAAVPCESAEAFCEAASELAGRRPALILVDQEFAACEESLEALRRLGSIVILLAAERSTSHPALDQMRVLIEAAAGANILGEY